MIVILDYDVGNVASVANMLDWVGVTATISRDPRVLREAKKIILPGVGAFDSAMRSLQHFELTELLDELVRRRGVPVLGICLGAQIMGKASQEGNLPGLGWLDFDLIGLEREPSSSLRVPHMGWNVVEPARPGIGVFRDVPDPMRFYFVHSYRMRPADADIVLGTTTYGVSFPTVVGKNNILAMQFHPEKSHKFGAAVLKNFATGFEQC